MVRGKEISSKSDTPTNSNPDGLKKRLEDELRQLPGMGDDLAESVLDNWQRVLVFAVVGVVAIVLIRGFGEVRAKNREETSKQFQEAQESFATFEKVALKKNQPQPTTKDEKKVEVVKTPEKDQAEPPKVNEDKAAAGEESVDDKTKEDKASEDKATAEHNEKAAAGFTETVNLLVNTQGSSSYGLLARLYKAVAAIEEQNYTEARRLLENDFGVKSFLSTTEVDRGELNENNISLDLATLLYARSFLAEAYKADNKPSESVKSAISAARALAERGVFANIEALLLLSRLGDDTFGQEELTKVAKVTLTNRPEIRAELEKQFPQLKL